MGCGTSKNDVIKSASSSTDKPKVKAEGSDTKANGKAKQSKRDESSVDSSSENSIDSEGSTIPASEKFGNGNSNGNNNERGFVRNSKNLPELPPLKPARTSKVGFLDQETGQRMAADKSMPVAFEVPAEEDSSLIKKHPPRRLRQLEERPPDNNTITQEALEEKVALANERRNQVLHQRVASARQKSARAGGRIRRPIMDSELEANETIESGGEGN